MNLVLKESFRLQQDSQKFVIKSLKKDYRQRELFFFLIFINFLKIFLICE